MQEKECGMQERKPTHIDASVARVGQFAAEITDLAERLATAYSSVTHHEPTPETAEKVRPNRAGSELAQNLCDIGDVMEKSIYVLRNLLDDCDL